MQAAVLAAVAARNGSRQRGEDARASQPQQSRGQVTRQGERGRRPWAEGSSQCRRAGRAHRFTRRSARRREGGGRTAEKKKKRRKERKRRKEALKARTKKVRRLRPSRSLFSSLGLYASKQGTGTRQCGCAALLNAAHASADGVRGEQGQGLGRRRKQRPAKRTSATLSWSWKLLKVPKPSRGTLTSETAIAAAV